MGRHKPESHPHPMKWFRRVISHTPLQVAVPHVMHVAIHCVNILICESPGHQFQYSVRRVEVVAVEYSHHVAGGHCDAFVHRVVYAPVRFAYPFHASVKYRFITA